MKSKYPINYTPLPNGHMLYREENGVGGYRYISDEIAGGVCVWDTAVVDPSTLLAAIVDFNTIEKKRKLGMK